MKNAYMLRNDGKEIPVRVHPYATDGWDYLLDVVPWLWENTQYMGVKIDILDFITSILTEEYGYDSTKNIENYISLLEEEYLVKLPSNLKESLISIKCNYFPLEGIYNKLNKELNQEFIRVRYGGRYNTSIESKEIVFRISSLGFNWFNVIWGFVFNHRKNIDYITVVTDLESLGKENYFNIHGINLDRVDVNTFLTLSGNPIIEKYDKEKEKDR